VIERLTASLIVAAAALGLAACGTGSRLASAVGRNTTTSTTSTVALPGTGKPQVTIGDKNFTEQFVLGELYYQALSAQGFRATLNRNIGPPEVTIGALETGRLDLYPEYLGTWNSAIADEKRSFPTAYGAYQAGQRYALSHGLELLSPTPFSDTGAIAVSFNYGAQNDLRSIGDLSKVAGTLTLGGPPQFQQSPAGLPALEKAYAIMPAFKALDVGEQYQALDRGAAQAANVNTTDGQLLTGNYTLLSDPLRVFGWGNVVPVASARVLDAEGPAFAATINKVSALLTLPVMRQLNSAVDVSHEDPAVVAKQFPMAHGLLPASRSANGVRRGS
jgi:osmoprotectant transport system substrate-binding protein